MAKPRHAIEAWGQYLAARSLVAGLSVFDIDTNLAAAGVVGRLIYRLSRKHRDRAADAIRQAFPQKTEAQVQRIAVASCEHFARMLVEAMQLPRVLHLDNWSQRVEMGDIGDVIERINRGKPAITLCGHFGNWEILGFVTAMLGYTAYAVARPLDNPLINDWLLGIRQRMGMRIIAKKDAVAQLEELLAAGHPVGLVADQNGGDKGLFVPFFGRLASTHKSVGLLAMAYDVPILVGATLRLGEQARYVATPLDVIDPSDWRKADDPLFYITARFMRAIELAATETPEQYLWMHRRWRSRPRWEKQDKPMPDSMRRKLEALPWMDQPTMDRLTAPRCHGGTA
jgi:KDO2-lipid IV(A) lauroyltransferase